MTAWFEKPAKMAQEPSEMKPVKRILVSQPQPENAKNPYAEIEAKFKVSIDFRRFIHVEGVPAKEFRKQRIDINEYSAIVLTSRNAIDHFFRVCEELRIRMPEATKYFCQSEAIAVYLQKYIQFRKRKVFYGLNGKESELIELLGKHVNKEKFLIPCASFHQDSIAAFFEEHHAVYKEALLFAVNPADLSDMKGKIMHDMIILFTSKGVESLFQNFPTFNQGDTRICGMGTGTQKTMEEHGLRIDIKAPTPELPSIFKAIENYLMQSNTPKKK